MSFVTHSRTKFAYKFHRQNTARWQARLWVVSKLLTSSHNYCSTSQVISRPLKTSKGIAFDTSVEENLPYKLNRRQLARLGDEMEVRAVYFAL